MGSTDPILWRCSIGHSSFGFSGKTCQHDGVRMINDVIDVAAAVDDDADDDDDRSA